MNEFSEHTVTPSNIFELPKKSVVQKSASKIAYLKNVPPANTNVFKAPFILIQVDSKTPFLT
jgi:hypothetical protein